MLTGKFPCSVAHCVQWAREEWTFGQPGGTRTHTKFYEGPQQRTDLREDVTFTECYNEVQRTFMLK